MERKNTILLTVIAIATLLVAVVGATFAYFTATLTPSNQQNNKVEATATTLPTVNFDYGNAVTVSEDIYPGYKFLKKVTVKGQCSNSQTSCKTVDLVLSLDPNIPTEFGSDIKYAVYKAAASNSDAITCSNTIVSEEDGNGSIKRSYNGKCTAKANVTEYKGENFDTAVSQGDIQETGYSGTFTDGEEVVILIEDVGADTNDSYYIVVDYANNPSSPQDTQQGKTFSITLDANLQA